MRKTFDESQVLFRYPSDNPIPRYVIVKDDSASSKIRVYCLNVGSYREASTGEYKAVIAILLIERAELIQQRDYEWKRRKEAGDARRLVETEREEMRLEIATLKAERSILMERLAKSNELLDVDRPGGEE